MSNPTKHSTGELPLRTYPTGYEQPTFNDIWGSSRRVSYDQPYQSIASYNNSPYYGKPYTLFN